jgi:hypothetical protein
VSRDRESSVAVDGPRDVGHADAGDGAAGQDRLELSVLARVAGGVGVGDVAGDELQPGLGGLQPGQYASLQLLDGEDAAPFTLAAGMPNYTGLFGRDAYVAALQTAALNPATLRGTLEVIGRWNARTTEDRYDAEPGKVLHQREYGPLARLGKTPFLHYYGDHSGPGLFLLAAAVHLAHTGDLAFFRSLRDKLLGTLAWMDSNADGEGFSICKAARSASPARSCASSSSSSPRRSTPFRSHATTSMRTIERA